MIKTRREFLTTSLAAGTAFLLPGLAHGGSISHLQGNVWINGRRAWPSSRIQAGDTVISGNNSEIVFVVDQDAYLLRGDSHLTLQVKDRVVSGLRLLTGAFMAVFGAGGKEIQVSTVTAGIRGTGIYAEARSKDEAYFCTCYGEVVLKTADAGIGETVLASHHSARFISNGDSGPEIVAAPMINHEDTELVLLESLVGREVPFEPM